MSNFIPSAGWPESKRFAIGEFSVSLGGVGWLWVQYAPRSSRLLYIEPKKKLSRDLNGTISTFAFINSFYSYLLLHNDWKSIHQSSCTVWKSLISFDISVSFEVGVDFFFFRLERVCPPRSPILRKFLFWFSIQNKIILVHNYAIPCVV